MICSKLIEQILRANSRPNLKKKKEETEKNCAKWQIFVGVFQNVLVCLVLTQFVGWENCATFCHEIFTL